MKLTPILLTLLLFLSSCAIQPEISNYGPGFFIGFWHGLIIWFSFIGSLFMNIRIYEFPNSGIMYDFGFIAGISMLIGLGTAGNRYKS